MDFYVSLPLVRLSKVPKSELKAEIIHSILLEYNEDLTPNSTSILFNEGSILFNDDDSLD